MADYCLPMLSAPLRLGVTLETIPQEIPYIAANPLQTEEWRMKLRDYRGQKVGLVWAGNPRHHDQGGRLIDLRRSIRLIALLPILESFDCTFFSLQKGDDARSEIKELPPEVRPVDWTDDLRDFADTAALVANLDLVISVDTSVAHLAGAMGKPVWILSRFDGCWRWLTDREDSPWYPTARLFRQNTPGDWASTIKDVAVTLDRWLCD